MTWKTFFRLTFRYFNFFREKRVYSTKKNLKTYFLMMSVPVAFTVGVALGAYGVYLFKPELLEAVKEKLLLKNQVFFILEFTTASLGSLGGYIAYKRVSKICFPIYDRRLMQIQIFLLFIFSEIDALMTLI